VRLPREGLLDMPSGFRWGLVGLVIFVIGVVPIVCYRMVYNHSRRLREVVAGRVYRSGQLTAAGFADAVEQLGIRTFINLQDDYPDPDVHQSFWTTRCIKESELCRKLGVHYVFIKPDLVSRRKVPEERPEAIEEFLRLMDDESNYPVLIHCKAGLHRTGVFTAVYRMEYQGWNYREAFEELRAHGFGDRFCTAANDYVKQYVLTYQPGERRSPQGRVGVQAAGLKAD
jgi:tyrosine-protein phosphatase SIW14